MRGNDSFVLKGKEAWEANTRKHAHVTRPDFMFDRVINVKINYTKFKILDSGEKQQEASSSIIIRSDYEPVASMKSVKAAVAEKLSPLHKAVSSVTNGRFDSSAETHFEKVRIKPDIRIRYRGHGPVGIKFDVVIGNFFSLVGDGDIAVELNSSSSGIELNSIEVLFGYMSQFPNLMEMPPGYSSNTYNNFADKRYSNASYLCGKVLYWYRSSPPPDGEYTFYCCIASVDANTLSQLSKVNESVYTANDFYMQLQDDYRRYIFSKGCSLESVLEWYLTKHYIRPNIGYSALDEEINDTANHCLSDLGKALYGVQVFVLSYNIYINASEKYYNTFIPLKNNVVSMLDAIKETYYPNLTFKFDVDGNVYVYDKDENFNSPRFNKKFAAVEALAKKNIDSFTKTVAGSDRNLRTARPQSADTFGYLIVPAVYSLQYGPMTQISCPYFSLLFPGQKIMFNASYSVARNQGASISTSVPDVSNYVSYTVLYYDIDFSTVSEYNNMNLYCIR